MCVENMNDLFEIEILNDNVEEQLPISLFQEIEADLCDRLLHRSSLEDDQTNGALEFIENIVNKIRSDLKDLLKTKTKKKKNLNILTKIFTILLSVKADSSEKIIKIVRLSISTVLKIWSERS